ncbi:specifically androgen-regulated gene protein isoform X1 [Scleropages formosus]|uniref:Specifically androgen-regulated gene protein-like n=1 Tax=Scleropages formosus TaxID=113540 RepID=A0A8C9VTZ3_SCLFO|nr:specifically androgen-regulated gene protein-like isoform X1 [Scleropages formosus]
MPRSDAWPSDVTVNTMAHTDSAGSCNSVVSINLGSSDDNLAYLSAEERACLMFLEETIESLEAEEDSGLSNDKSERPPGVTGSLAARIAHLSSVMARGRQDNLPKYTKKDPGKEVTKEQKPFMSNRVATPFVLAKDSSSIQPKGGMKVSPKNANSCIKPQADAADRKPESSQNKPKSDSAASRGPLSYEGLVQLRKSASTKNATTSSSSESKAKQSPGPAATVQLHSESLHAPASHSPSQPAATPQKLNPPVVPPKPKLLQSSIIHKANIQVAGCSTDSDESSLSTSPSEIVMDPQRVRNEALRKLGLLKSGEAPVHPVRTRQISEPALMHPDPDLPQIIIGKAQPTSSLGAREIKAGPANLQAADSSEIKLAVLERSGIDLANSVASLASSDHSSKATPKGPPINFRNSRPRPSSLGNQKDFEGIQDRHFPTASGTSGLQEAVKSAPVSTHRPHGASVVIKPRCSTGEDRQEALRKLGLLKNKES